MDDGTGGRTIVHVVESALAGVGRHVVDLAHGQAAIGHDVHVVFSPLREDRRFAHARSTSEHVEFHPLDVERNPALSDLAARRRLGGLIDWIGPDVVHAHSSKAGLLVRSLARSRPITVLYTPHAVITLNPELRAWQRRVAAFVERNLARRTDCVVAVSEHELDHLHSIGVLRERTSLVPNGIAPIVPRPTSDEVRGELGLPLGVRVVGFVGRLAAQKNPEALFAALPWLDADVQLAFVGDGPLRPRLDGLADEESADRIHLLGDRDGHRAMFGFDCLVIPSRYESAPYVAMEARDAGIPVVTAAGVPGGGEWSGECSIRAASLSGVDLAAAITSGLTAGSQGEFVDPPTVEQMVAAVEALLRHRR
jgi:glycosyltransferase involved in cell wall biosynthesis